MRRFRIETCPQFPGVAPDIEILEMPDSATPEAIDEEIRETAHEMVSRVCDWTFEEIDESGDAVGG